MASAEKEREVFKSFARVCPLEIREESIESRPQKTKEPDILCEVVGEGPVAFELTTVEAKKYRAAWAEQDRTLRKALEFSREIVKYPHLVERYRGTYIFLDKPGLSVEDIIELLNTAPLDREELFLMENGMTLERDDGDHAPRIVADAIKILHDISKHIQAKFDKVADETLLSPHPIEILAYFHGLWAKNIDWQHESEKLRREIVGLLPNSKIRRVWIYDPRDHIVRFVYPAT